MSRLATVLHRRVLINQQAPARILPQYTNRAHATLAAIPNFDLTHVMSRVAKENPDWTPERLNSAENAYRVFMAQAKATPREEHHNPSKDMDEVWHSHILHTRQYVADCSAYFGFFFHHTPFIGDEEKDSKMAMCTGNCGSSCDRSIVTPS